MIEKGTYIFTNTYGVTCIKEVVGDIYTCVPLRDNTKLG